MGVNDDANPDARSTPPGIVPASAVAVVIASPSRQAVVVGAGPGGLAAAMLLASQGVEVTVLERLARVGGRTSTIAAETDRGTFRFDLGPTFFLYPAVLEEIFSACGRDLHEEVELVRLDPQYRLVFEGRSSIDATPNVTRMQEAIAAFSPADAANLPRFLADNRAKFEAFRPILQRPFDSWRDVASLELARSLPKVRPWSNVDADLRRYFRDPSVRLAFSFQSKYLGMSPFTCPSLFTILSYLEYDYGVYHPVGGCGAVSEAMARAARDMGVDIRLQEPVEELLFDGRRAVGARTARASYHADAVVVNADFAQAMHQLVPDRLRRRYSDARLERKKYSCSTYMLYLGLEGELPELEHHTILLAEDYTRNLREIEQDHVLSEQPSLYVQNAARTDPTLAPPGMSTLYVLAPVTHEHPNVDWTSQQRAFRASVLRRLELLGLHDLEDRIVYEKALTPPGWREELNVFRGATFNLAHTVDQMLHLRPHNRFEEFDNMYLVGGGTHPGSGLPVIYEGARISARLLLEDLGVAADFAPAHPAGRVPSAQPLTPAGAGTPTGVTVP